MTNSSPPNIDCTQEVRFAVVMYGGISLAIYINGVAQELLHLVRSTAKQPDKNCALLADTPSVSNASSDGDTDRISGTERVYRKLGQMLVRGGRTRELTEISELSDIRTQFVVDILSGSSAGGINAVFLAKALANNQPLKKLEHLWVEEGDMKVLINDRGSLESTELKLQDPPKSLLNSQRMYWELLDALEGMEAGVSNANGSVNKVEPMSLVEELDLFVTATDMHGQIIKLQLADRMVEERRHRKVFHFVYNAEKDPVSGRPQNDFGRDNNPFLAFAARSTSAHPAAFEPMSLVGIDDALERHENYKNRSEVRSNYLGWQKFYNEYLQQPDAAADVSSEDAKKAREDSARKFSSRPFNDGGVLDNQPFSHTIDALPTHHSDYPTTRKLLYIEPAPENPHDDPQEMTPDFVENAWLSLSTLPRYEPIREHLQRVLDRNHLVERVEHITRGMEKDIETSGRPHLFNAVDFARADLATMIETRGYGWASYQRLRVGEVTDELVLLIARALGFNEDSDEFRAIRYVVRYWRMQHYASYPKSAKSADAPTTAEFTETKFLMDFDLPWRLRRLRFVMGKIDDLACFDKDGENTFRAALNESERILPYPDNSEANRDDRRRLRNVLLKMKASFNDSYKTLRFQRRQLWSSPRDTKAEVKAKLLAATREIESRREAIRSSADSPELLSKLKELSDESNILAVRDALNDLDIKSDQLAMLLARLTEKQRDQKLAEIVDAKKAGLRNLETKLRNLLLEWISQSRKTCDDALAREDNSSAPDEMAIRHAVAFYFDYFDFYDMIAHPILYATNAGDELDRIEVFRVSPEDATSLINETITKKRKLAGTKLANFGAFFKREFRTNDILWGRLDGAERIITALLPDEADHKNRKALVEEAHSEILKETLGVEDESQLISILKTLSECADKTADDGDDKSRFSPAGEEKLSNVVSDARIKFALGTFLSKKTPTDYFKDQFLEKYETDRQFNSQDMIKDAARASKVFGKMLEGYAKLHQFDNKRVVWVTRLAQVFWGMVEVAIPDSIANLVFHHWLKLLYLFEFLLILLGTLLTSHTAQQFGLLTFALTVAVHAAQVIVTDALKAKNWVLRLGVALLVILVAVLVVSGAVTLSGFLSDSVWHLMTSTRAWIKQPQLLGWNGKTLSDFGLLALVGTFLGRAFWRESSEQSRTRAAGIMTLILGAAITAGVIVPFISGWLQHKSLPGGFHLPGLAIEMVQEPADVTQIKDSNPDLRSGVSADFGFIALYTLVFLSFSYWLAGRKFSNARILGKTAAVLAAATAGFDVLENLCLYRVIDTPHLEAWMLANLHIATLLKWSFCFFTVGLLSLLFILRKDYLRAAGYGLVFAAVAGLAGLFFFHPVLEAAFGFLGIILTLIGLQIAIAPKQFLADSRS